MEKNSGKKLERNQMELLSTQNCNEIMFGSREESEVADFFVFSHIWIMGYFRLGKG